MNFIKKYTKDIFLGVGITIAYFITHLFNLGLLPIFTDEAIYLRWSQIMAYDAALRYLPLIDGKPPLFMWLVSIAMRLFSQMDPLVVGRLVSVFSGFFGLIGIYFTAYQLFKNKKIAYLSAIFYLLTPFTFFYDRFTTADSLLSALGIWSLGIGVLLVKTLRLDVALIEGIVLGLAFLTKSPATLFLLFLPVNLILFDFKSKNIPRRLLKFGGLLMIIVVVSQSIYSILRLFPLFHMITQKNSEFIISLSEFLKQPFGLFLGNIKSLILWEYLYTTPLIFASAIVGFLTIVKDKSVTKLILLSFFLIPLFAMASFNKVIYVRYLLPFTPGLLILAASAIAKIKNFTVMFIICVILLALPIYTDFKLLTDPINAPIPQADRDQYLDGWAAGFGVNEVRAYIATLSGHQVIATEGTFGLMPYALELDQKDYPNVEIKSYWPLPNKIPAGTNYVLIYQHPNPPAGWKVEEVLRFRQGKGSDYLRLYKIL